MVRAVAAALKGQRPELRDTPNGDLDILHQRLSDREYQVLRMIGAGRTVTEIGTELDLSVNTVSTYRARILEKLQLRTSAELIRYAVVNKLVP